MIVWRRRSTGAFVKTSDSLPHPCSKFRFIPPLVTYSTHWLNLLYLIDLQWTASYFVRVNCICGIALELTNTGAHFDTLPFWCLPPHADTQSDGWLYFLVISSTTITFGISLLFSDMLVLCTSILCGLPFVPEDRNWCRGTSNALLPHFCSRIWESLLSDDAFLTSFGSYFIIIVRE